MTTPNDPIRIDEIPADRLPDIVPLLRVLDPSIAEATLRERVAEMARRGFHCFGAYDGERLVGCCGAWVLTKYYIGRHVEPDDVVVLPEYRSTGVGAALMDRVHAFGRDNGCAAAELNCYVGNGAGHKFWFNRGYRVIAFHFRREL